MARAQQLLALAPTRAKLGIPTGRVLVPSTFGADPSGLQDSTAAFKSLVQQAIDGAPNATGGGGQVDAIDLGGVVVDLSGGAYRLTAPITFPSGSSNFHITSGTLFADPSFGGTGNASILQLGGRCQSGALACGSGATVSDLTIHGAGVAWGGIVADSMQNVDIGGCLLTGFTGVGVAFPRTGAGYLHHSWLGEQEPGGNRNDVSATAVDLAAEEQHDCYCSSVIIWSSLIGIRTANRANEIMAVHPWNLAAPDGGIGILVEKGGGFMRGLYMDFAPLVVLGPDGLSVADSFFLGTASIVLATTPSNAWCSHVTLENNMFRTTNKSINLDETAGAFVGVSDTVMSGSQFPEKAVTPLSTRATLSADLDDVSNVTLSFGHALAFPRLPIESVECSLVAMAPVAWAAQPIRESNPTDVSVVLAAPTTGSITCTVDQSKRTIAAH